MTELGEALSTSQAASEIPVPDGIGNQSVITRFQKERFFERFNAMITATGEYEGTLPEAFDSSDFLPVDKAEGPSGVSGPGNHHEIDKLRKRLHNARVNNAVIEAAHLYLYQDIGDEEIRQSVMAQCSYAADLSEQLEDDGINVRQVVFIDDYNPNPDSGELEENLDIPSFLEAVKEVGYDPSIMLREASMVPLAKKMLEVMSNQGVTKITEVDSNGESTETPQESVLLDYRNIELYRPDEDKVSCAMLDTALTVVKLRFLGEAVINVLPRRHESQPFSYKGQQKKMRHILGMHLGARIMPIFNLFTGDNLADPISAGSHNALRKRH